MNNTDNCCVKVSSKYVKCIGKLQFLSSEKDDMCSLLCTLLFVSSVCGGIGASRRMPALAAYFPKLAWKRVDFFVKPSLDAYEAKGALLPKLKRCTGVGSSVAD